MKRITTTAMGLAALVAMLVLGVFSAGVAQAHTFLWQGAAPSLLLILGDGPQKFQAVPGGPTVECKHVHLDGTVSAESQLAVTVKGTYTGCEVAFQAATISEVEYSISADETVSVINKTIEISTSGLVNCTIKVLATANNQSLKTIRYLVDPSSSSLRLLAHAEVENIHSDIEGGGGACGSVGLHTEGSYRGLLLAWAHAPGTLKWS
jgi:hypothetical protein